MKNLNLTPLIQAIYEQKERLQVPRFSNGIGCSVVGSPCKRKLWYDFRWAQEPQKFDGRMLSLFDDGKNFEPVMLSQLRALGLEVCEHDGTGAQFRVEGLGGHLSGYLDGVVRDPTGELLEGSKAWHLLELKTHNDKSFTYLSEHGLKKGKPEHWAQCVMGMGLAEPQLTRALYIAKNKNNSELYAERVRFVKKDFDKLKEAAEGVIFSPEPPSRFKEKLEGFPCAWCSLSTLCFQRHQFPSLAETKLPVVNCRTCVHSTPEPGGAWTCDHPDPLNKEVLSKEMQELGCKSHLFIPDLLPFECLGLTEDEGGISYRTMKGEEVVNLRGGRWDES